MFQRILAAMLIVLFTAPVEVLAQTLVSSYFVPSKRVQGVGKDRENVTAIGLDIRTSLAQRAQWFWIMKRPEARAAPKRIFESPLWHIIERAAKAKGLDPMVLAARIYLESWGDCNARVSQTNIRSAAGCGQFTAAGAKDEGLVILTRVQKVPKVVNVRQGKKVVKKTIMVSQTVVVRDDRLNPNLAIPAMASRIARRTAVYGRGDFEIAEYHMGAGNLLKALSLYTGERVDSSNAGEVIRRRGLSYPLVFFHNTVRYKKNLYDFFAGLSDYSPTYFFRIQAAHELLKIYRGNPKSYETILEQYRPKFEGRIESPNRMWSYYGAADVKKFSILSFTDLLDAWKSKRIMPMPNNPQFFGVKIRTTGQSPIGEAVLNPKDKQWYNPANQKWYMGSEPATLGCLLYIAYELREFERERFQPLENNSLVRDLAAQIRIAKGNPVARTELPTHVMGKASDLPRKLMSAEQFGDLLFILRDMESLGLLSWIQEGGGGQLAFHVVPDPSYADFYESIYKDAQAFMR